MGETVQAEGTKAASPSPINCTALAILPSRGNGAYLGCGENNRIYFRITDYTSEKLYYGFNWQKYGGGVINNMYMKIFAPDGSLEEGPIMLPVSGAGVIYTYDQAVTGPHIKAIPSSGYLPLSFTPKSNGEYWVEIYRSNDQGVSQANKSTWSYSPYFDFTVATTEGEVHPGRVHCGKWGFVAINPETFKIEVAASASPILYPLTNDGVVYQLSFQEGFEPIDFNIAMTSYGITNSGNWIQDRKSRNDIISPQLSGGFPIFLNPPDPKVYPYAVLPPMPTFASPPIIGCHPGPYTIRFNISQDGDCRIFLNLNDEAGYQLGTSDRIIDIPGCKKGLNTYVWDGKDGFGNIVPAGKEIGVSLIYNKGRGNLPIFDAEINEGGFNIACIAPIKEDHLRIYWDDSGLKNVGRNKTNDLNNTTGAGLDNSIVGAITPAHAWNGDGNLAQTIPAPSIRNNNLDNYQSNDFGNVRTINSWFWGVELMAYSTAKAMCVSISGTVKVPLTDQTGKDFNYDNLYVLLVDPTTDNVLDLSTVNTDGTYTLTNCPINGENMVVMLSATPGTIGNPPPQPSIPANWGNKYPLTHVISTSTSCLSDVNFDLISTQSTIIKGYIKDRNTLKAIQNVTIFFLDQAKMKVYIAKTDTQGEYILHVNTPCHGIIKAMTKNHIENCLSFQTDKESTRIESQQSLLPDLLLDEIFIGKTWRLGNIQYDFNKWNISAGATPILDSLVTILKTYPIKVELGSHTDCRGPNSYNDLLSQRRAESAATYLVQHGIAANRILAKGYGKHHLLNHCSDGVPCSEEEHQANRRTEVKVIGYMTDNKDSINLVDPANYKAGEQFDSNFLPPDFFKSCK